MDNYVLSLVAQMHACNARVEGMKAANASQAISGCYPLYKERDFQATVSELFQLADAIRNAQQEGAPPVFFVKQDGTHGEYPPADPPMTEGDKILVDRIKQHLAQQEAARG